MGSTSKRRHRRRRWERSRDQKGYYVEYQGSAEDVLFVSLGARYDDNDDFGSHTSARLSLAYVRIWARARS